MKANELMIDDLVDVHRCECVADDGHYAQWDEYGKVVSITECYITIKYIGREDDYGFEDVEEKDINPILLTAEILLKNGFKQRKQDGEVQYILTADYYDVYVNEYPDGWWLVEYEDSERGDLPTERIAARNVHQLQDAFRLFGVEKEIEL